MLDSTQPIPLDYQLPAHAYWHLIRTLRLTLPPPADDGAEALLKRDHAAIARIAAFAPADAAEADVAAEFVAASEQWKDCLRLAREPGITREWAMKCRAQALAMMRQANSALRLLAQMQRERRKLQPGNAACDRREWTEHVATAMMAEALGDNQPDAAEPSPSPAQALAQGAAAPAPDRSPVAAAAPQPQPAEEPELDPVAEAELYAVLYPERAALIRRFGRVPDNVTFGPPDDEIVAALIAARTPALAALDHAFPNTAAA